MRDVAKVLTLALFLAVGSAQSSHALFGNDAAPFTRAAAKKIENNIDTEKLEMSFVKAKTECNMMPRVRCYISPLRVIDSFFSGAGYSFDKTLRLSYANRNNAQAAFQLGYTELFLLAFTILKAEGGRNELLRSGIISEETLKVIESIK